MIKKLAKELKNLESPPEGIIGVNDYDFSVSEAGIEVPGMQLCPKFNLFKKYREICWRNTLGFAAVSALKKNVSRMKQLLSRDFRRPPLKGG